MFLNWRLPLDHCPSAWFTSLDPLFHFLSPCIFVMLPTCRKHPTWAVGEGVERGREAFLCIKAGSFKVTLSNSISYLIHNNKYPAKHVGMCINTELLTFWTNQHAYKQSFLCIFYLKKRRDERPFKALLLFQKVTLEDNRQKCCEPPLSWALPLVSHPDQSKSGYSLIKPDQSEIIGYNPCTISHRSYFLCFTEKYMYMPITCTGANKKG